jgi:hypothetical protein
MAALKASISEEEAEPDAEGKKKASGERSGRKAASG